jgi:ADP-heptose:LPS heptosyltransferase
LKVLVIKHGALGDIVLAFPAFAGIRAAHPGAEITLLTRKPYAGFLAASPWFNKIETDDRPAPWNTPGILRLRRQLRGFDMVYDLQTSSRSSRYFALAGRPPWSGIAKGCAFPHADPARKTMHTRERLAAQLAAAGIAALPKPDLSWMVADVSRFNLPEQFALLVPGAAAHRPEKRWPAGNFKALANRLSLPCVLVGGPGEQLPVIVPGMDLIGRTNLLELGAITARSGIAIGNDTGPMHLAAAVGVPSVVLFSAASDPALTAPRYPDGGWPKILRAPDLAELTVAEVIAALP